METAASKLGGARLVRGTLVHEVSPGLVQVGSNPEHSVLLSGMHPMEVAWLKSLANREDPRSLLNRAKLDPAPLPPRKLEALTLIDAVGLLESPNNPTQKMRVVISGLDEVGVRTTKLLAETGLSHIEVRDKRLVDLNSESWFPASFKGLPRQSAARSMISQISPATCVGKIAVPDIAIVCSSRTLDFGRLGFLLSHDTAHLPIVTDDRSVSVGPLVLPGVTACALCWELHVRDRAPGWSAVTGALKNLGPTLASPHLSSTAAGIAVGLVDAVARGGVPAVWAAAGQGPTGTEPGGCSVPGATPIYTVRATGVEMTPCLPHPECGCVALTSIQETAV